MSAPKYPPPAPGVFRITQSELEEYLKCGLRHAYSRQSPRRRATVAMTIGSAVSRAAAHDNRNKMERGFGLPLADIVEAGVNGYEDELKQTQVEGSLPELSAGKDEAADASRAYGLGISPLIQDVLGCEEPIIATIAPNFEIAGTPDVIDRAGLGDTKSGKEWSQIDVDHSRQLTLYSLLYFARYREFPPRVWIDNVYRSRNGWKARRIYSHRTPHHYAGIIEILKLAKAAIDAGIQLPPPEWGAWYCSPCYCPFFKTCIIQGAKQ